MPEQTENQISMAEEDLQHKYEEHLARAQSQLVEIYQQTTAEGKDPLAALLDQAGDLSDAKRIYGAERVETLWENLQKITFTDQEGFVEAVMALNTPIIRLKYFDPECAQRAKEADQEQSESVVTGKLSSSIHPCDWHLDLGSGVEVNTSDRVLEIGWPEQPVEGPRGLRDLKNSFREIAKVLQQQPDIKAVVAVSWMMSYPMAEKLGFRRFPDIKFEEAKIKNIVDLASTARSNKAYNKIIDSSRVMVGAISSPEFIKKFLD